MATLRRQKLEHPTLHVVLVIAIGVAITIAAMLSLVELAY